MYSFKIKLILSTAFKSAGIKPFKARPDKDYVSQLGPMIVNLFSLFFNNIIIFTEHFGGVFPQGCYV